MSERSFLMEHYTLPHRHNQSMSQLMSHLPNIEEFQTTADIFKQLSDPHPHLLDLVPLRRMCYQHRFYDGNEQSCRRASFTSASFKRSDRIPQGRKRNILPCRRLEKNTNASSYDRKDHGYFLHKQRRINQNLTQIYRF